MSFTEKYEISKGIRRKLVWAKVIKNTPHERLHRKLKQQQTIISFLVNIGSLI